MGKILKRCSVCGNFHAAYVVEDARLGKLLLCYNCWKNQYAGVEPPKPETLDRSNSLKTGSNK